MKQYEKILKLLRRQKSKRLKTYVSDFSTLVFL